MLSRNGMILVNLSIFVEFFFQTGHQVNLVEEHLSDRGKTTLPLPGL